jgi:chromosome partitioning protein
MIYTIGGQKGGSGKTTVATNLAILLSTQGRDVLLVDADDQETATDFTALREERTQDKAGYTAIKLTGVPILKQIPKLAERYQDIVIDTGGRDTESQRAALTVSNVYLVPFVPRSFDIWTLEKVEFLVEQARTVNPRLKAFVFINRADPRGADNEDAAEYLKQSSTLVFLDAPIGNRKAFATAAATGHGIVETKGVDEKAVSEFNKLFAQVNSTLSTV